MPYTLNVDFKDTATKTALTTYNFVAPSGFRLLIDSQKYPNAQYMVQTISLPDMSVQPAQFATPQRNIGMLPDKVEYSPLDLTFLVDEELLNYKEIHDWMIGLVTSEDAPVRKERDLTLAVLNSANNVSKEIQFIDAFPISLSSLPFDTTATDVEYLTAACTFQYSYFKITG